MPEVEMAIELLQADLEKNNFGRGILYDGAKYLHRAFERWANISIEDVNPYIFENLRKRERQNCSKTTRQLTRNTSLYSYMRDYLHSEELGVKKEKIEPPIDMVFQKCDLETCEESKMTFWTMRIIIDACYLFKDSQGENLIDESLIKTQEDMYYYTLSVLNNSYSVKDGVR